MKLNYTSIGFILFFHSLALFGLVNFKINMIDIQMTLLMYFITGFGVTVGYHRLWAHRSYKASYIVQAVLAILGAGALQGSILWWSKYHRLHHNKSDTDDDPYGPQLGFLHSHIIWIFENKKLNKLKTINVSDLTSNPIVVFQHKYYVIISLLCSIGFPLVYYIFNGYNIYNCLFYPVALARVILWHSTWFVNSLAHTLGTQTYGKSGTSRDHFLTALLTFGEGYHNFHHEFPYDYRNAIHWYQYDPSKWIIEILYFLGLVTDLKTNNDLNNKIKEQQKRKDITLNEYHDLCQKENQNLIVYKGGVYDLTDLLKNHPGGYHNIKIVIGKSEEFFEQHFKELNNHTHNAIKLLNKCKICNIKKE